VAAGSASAAHAGAHALTGASASSVSAGGACRSGSSALVPLQRTRLSKGRISNHLARLFRLYLDDDDFRRYARGKTTHTDSREELADMFGARLDDASSGRARKIFVRLGATQGANTVPHTGCSCRKAAHTRSAVHLRVLLRGVVVVAVLINFALCVRACACACVRSACSS
jgi:hypothetical protein